MRVSAKTLKKKFDRDLKHIKVILNKKRLDLPQHEWLLLVDETKKKIMDAPHEFFSYKLPSPSVVAEAVELVFEGFLNDQRIREVQRKINFKNYKLPL